MAWTDGDTTRRRYHVGNLRAELLQHARSILEDAGLSGLNLRGLAARAGIAPGSVYHHYVCKAALLAGLAMEGFRELQAALERVVREAPQGARFRTFAQVYFTFARSQPALYALMFDPAMMADPQVAAARDGAFAVLEGLVTLALAPVSESSPCEMRKAALSVWACGHGAVTMMPPQPEADDELVEDVIRGLEVLFRRP